jgi:ubiquinone/menaquinone biosynthesis C-methylase UbiE
MKRIPEPELMNDPDQAQAYARADFEEPNSRFVRLFQAAFPGLAPATILDLGCGPADIAIRLARLLPAARVDGVDGAPAMLRLGAAAIAAAGLQGRVQLWESVLPALSLPDRHYEAVVSNSLLHHMADPAGLWQAVRKWGAPGVAVLVMDLKRPASRAEAAAIVDTYGGEEPAILREDFFNSLLAAYRPAEVAAQLARAGLSGLRIEEVSDRHLAVRGILP